MPKSSGVTLSKIVGASAAHNEVFKDGWFEPDVGGRWMGRDAKIAVGRMETGSFASEIHGWIPQQLLNQGSISMEIIVAGKSRCKEILRATEVNLSCEFRISDPVSDMPIEIRLNRSVRVPPDPRDLSFFLEFVEVRSIASIP